MSGKSRSAAAYYGGIQGGHANKQNSLVIAIMLTIDEPMPIRMLHKALNGRGYQIDLVSLRRAVTNLSVRDKRHGWLNHYGKAVIHAVYEKPCPITRKRVGWYQIIPGALQLEMFPVTKKAA